jgi:hypothetical protein
MKKLLFVFMLSVLMIGAAWGQTDIHSNACASATTGWTFTNGGGQVIQQGGYWLVDHAGDSIISESFDVSAYTDLTLTFNVGTYGSGTNHACKVEYSTDNGDTWNATTFTSATPTSSTMISAGTWDMGTIITSQLKLKWTSPDGGSKGVRIDDILLKGTLSVGNPTLSVGTLSMFENVVINNSSTQKTYNISGSNLTADIVVTPPN